MLSSRAMTIVENKQWYVAARAAQSTLLELAEFKNMPDYLFDNKSVTLKKEYIAVINSFVTAFGDEEDYGFTILAKGLISLEVIKKEIEVILCSDADPAKRKQGLEKDLLYIQAFSSPFGMKMLEKKLLNFSFDANRLGNSLARFLTREGLIVLQLIMDGFISLSEENLISQPILNLLANELVVNAFRSRAYNISSLAKINPQLLPLLATPEAVAVFTPEEVKSEQSTLALKDFVTVDVSKFQLLFNPSLLKTLKQRGLLALLRDLTACQYRYLGAITSTPCLSLLSNEGFYTIQNLQKINHVQKISIMASDHGRAALQSSRPINLEIINKYINHEVLNYILSSSEVMEFIQKGELLHANFFMVGSVNVAAGLVSPVGMKNLISSNKSTFEKLPDVIYSQIYGYLYPDEKIRITALISRKQRALQQDEKNSSENNKYKQARTLLGGEFRPFLGNYFLESVGQIKYLLKYLTPIMVGRENDIKVLLKMSMHAANSFLYGGYNSRYGRFNNIKRSDPDIEYLMKNFFSERGFDVLDRHLVQKLGEQWREAIVKIEFFRLDSILSHENMQAIAHIAHTALHKFFLNGKLLQETVFTLARSLHSVINGCSIPISRMSYDPIFFLLDKFLADKRLIQIINYLAAIYEVPEARKNLCLMLKREDFYDFFGSLPDSVNSRQLVGISLVFLSDTLFAGLLNKKYMITDFLAFDSNATIEILKNQNIHSALARGDITTQSLVANPCRLKNIFFSSESKEDSINSRVYKEVKEAESRFELIKQAIKDYINTPLENRLNWFNRNLTNEADLGTIRAKKLLEMFRYTEENSDQSDLHRVILVFAVIHNKNATTLKEFILKKLGFAKPTSQDLKNTQDLFTQDMFQLLGLQTEYYSEVKENLLDTVVTKFNEKFKLAGNFCYNSCVEYSNLLIDVKGVVRKQNSLLVNNKPIFNSI